MVRVAKVFMRAGRNDYRRVDVRTTDDRYLDAREVTDGSEPLKLADRYAAGRPRNN